MTLDEMMQTIVIVDDHPAFRASARRLLELEGYRVVGEAVDAASALSTVRAVRPDVVLLDVVLPDGSGLDVAEQLASPNMRIVLVSSRDRADLGARLSRSAAVGFIPKSELTGERLAAVLGSPPDDRAPAAV